MTENMLYVADEKGTFFQYNLVMGTHVTTFTHIDSSSGQNYVIYDIAIYDKLLLYVHSTQGLMAIDTTDGKPVSLAVSGIECINYRSIDVLVGRL